MIMSSSLLSCEVAEPPEKKHLIGFSQCIREDDWRMSMERDMLRELYFHEEMALKILDGRGDTELQKEQVQSLIDENVDLLIISALEAEPLVEMVELAHSKNIPTILLDRKVNTDKFTAFIGANNYEIGLQAGKYVKTHFPTAKIVEIWGLKGSSPAIERHRGFHDGIEGAEAEVLREIQLQLENENFSIDKRILLDNLEDIDLVFGHTDVITYNSYKIIQEKDTRQDIKFIGIDGLFGENMGIDLVKKGVLETTFLYPTGGKEAIKLAKRILAGEKVPKQNELFTTKIDSSNIELIRFQENKISEEQANIELQQQIISMQDELNSKQRGTILLMVLVSISIFILSALLYRSLQQKNRKNQELISVNEEISRQKVHIERVSEQVEKLTEEKIRYFTNISHEFRTPLTLMLTPLNEMINSSDQRSSFNLNLIKKNSLRLQRLINQLMDFRKIEFNQLNMVVNEISIEEFLEDLMPHFNHLANSKAIQFELENTLSLDTIWGDINLLDKVIFNLLSNAFKFTPEGGKVLIRLSENEKSVMFHVKNTGPRISREQAEHIFERYYTDGVPSGVGIGLSLSKEFIELHKGSIRVDNEDKDYTSFVVSVPKGKSHFPLGTVYHSGDIRRLREEDDTFLEAKHFPVATKEKNDDLPYVLIIEDNKDLTHYLSNSLSNQFNISIANTGKEGIRLAYEQIPDIIVCDIKLANMNGYEILDQLKQDIKTSHIPIIMLTANQEEKHKLEAFRKGAESYLTKPFNLELLIENINGQLLNRNLLKQYYAQFFGVSEIKDNIDISFINEFKKIVSENLDNADFTVDQIYKHLGLSRIQLYRKVKAVLGCGVHDYILDYRIKEAQKLLAQQGISIKEVAYRTGFTSPSYFSTIFKSKTNLTPSEYKHTL